MSEYAEGVVWAFAWAPLFLLYLRRQKRNRMKQGFIFLLLSICLVGCMPSKPEYKQWVKLAEQAWPVEPEEARAWLDSVKHPSLLSDKWVTRYCVLACRLADSIGTPLPYEDELDRALYYLEQHGEPIEQARMGFYWGRALQEEGLHRPAMEAFLAAEARSREAEDWHLTARICQEIGDLYHHQADYDSARDWMKKSVKLFQRTADQRSLGLTWRLLGKEYASLQQFDTALVCMQRADSLIWQLGDSADISTIYNNVGNVYHMMGNLPKAKEYLYCSIAFDPDNSAPTYFALGSLYLKEDSLEKAEYFLSEAKKPTSNPDTHEELIFHYALLEEKKGNFTAALDSMKKYIRTWERYVLNLEEVDLDRDEALFKERQMAAKYAQQWRMFELALIGALLLGIVALLIILVYRSLAHKRKILLQQQALDIERLKNSILEKDKILQLQSHQLLVQQQTDLNQLTPAEQEHKRRQEELNRLQQQQMATSQVDTSHFKQQLQELQQESQKQIAEWKEKYTQQLQKTERLQEDLLNTQTQKAQSQEELGEALQKVDTLAQQLKAQRLESEQTKAAFEEQNQLFLAKMDRLKEEMQNQINYFLEQTPVYGRVKECLDSSHKQDLNAEDWVEVRNLIHVLYPHLINRLVDARLSEREQQYCFLALLGFSPKEVSFLMKVGIDSPTKAYNRIRTKLGMTDPAKRTIQYLAEMGLSS